MKRRMVVLAALAALTVTAHAIARDAKTALAEDPPTHEAALELLAEIGCSASKADLHGDTLYVVLNARLATLDVSRAAAPELISAGPALHGKPLAVAADGSFAYVALGEEGLAVVDVRDPANPMLVGAADTSDGALDVAVDGGHAFVAVGRRGLQVFDVSDPTAPVAIGALRTHRFSRSLVASDGWVYIGERNDLEYGLWVVDATDPTAPRDVAFADIAGGGDRVAQRDNVVYMSRVIAAGNPLNPSSGYTLGVAAVDVTDPERPAVFLTSPPAAAPSVAASTAQVPRGAEVVVHDLAVGDDRLYLVGGAPSTTANSGQLYPGARSTSGNFALLVYSLTTNPRRPAESGFYSTTGMALGVAGNGDQAFVADGSHGVVVVDSRAREPDLVGVYDSDIVGRPVALDAELGTLAIADSGHGLRLADVSVPEAPDLIGDYETESAPTDVDLERGYAYVALERSSRSVGGAIKPIGGIHIVSVADPANPVRGSEAIQDVNASAVEVEFSRAYVTSWKGADYVARDPGLHVVDVSDPLKPSPKVVFEDVLEPSDVAFSGDVAYVTGKDTGVWAIDVRVPEEPSMLSFVGTHGPAAAVAAYDGYAYVADGPVGLVVADMRDPNAPDRIATLGTDGAAVGVDVSGTIVAVAASKGGVRLIDVTDQAAPREVDELSGRGTAISVEIAGDLVYVGLEEGTIQVFRIVERELPTATPTATATDTPSPTHTPTPTPTNLPDTWTIWLPSAFAP